MKNSTTLSGKLYWLLLIVFMACQPNDFEVNVPVYNEQVQERENAFIVVFRDGAFTGLRADMDYAARKSFLGAEAAKMIRGLGSGIGEIEQVYGGAMTGFSVVLNDLSKVEELRSNTNVKYLENDKMITLAPPPGKGKGGSDAPAPQETPWGISRVNGGTNYTGSNAAWVIDSGIDLDHPDLNVDTNRSMSFLSGKDSNNPDDANGHGTHVAGTIAAINNDHGVIGVAAGAPVISIRVLDRRGSGYLSGVIAGVDYVGANGNSGDVANMSLGGGVSQALDDAVVAASAGGVDFVLAAGNSADDANNHSPARANGNNIYTISAMNSSDVFASFSNYGNPPIDYCAPGVSVLSTWKSGGYNTISGTSMAAPHAAGVLLLGVPRTSGTVINDPDGNPDPIISY